MWIEDHLGNAVAFIENRLIIDFRNLSIIGVVLGNCVYNRDGECVGKIFDDFFRNKEGYITGRIAKSVEDKAQPKFQPDKNEAWKIITRARSSECEWIPAKQTWDKDGWEGYLCQAGVPAVV